MEVITESDDVLTRNPESSSTLDLKFQPSEIKKLLECPVCYEIILPPITLCNGGHAVCNSCRENLKSCPSCRGKFTNIRNRFAEDFLDKCLVLCRFAEAGCNVALPGRELASHHQNCNYRPLICRECDKEIPYHLFLEHLRDEEKLETQRATECSTGFEIEDDELLRTEGGDKFSVWEPTWIHAFGEDFFCFLETVNSHWWIWVGGYCTPTLCDKFICSITVWNKEARTEMKYVGKVHPLRTPPNEVFNSGLCLSFMDVNLSNLMYKGGIDVLVRIDTDYVAPRTRKGIMVESPLAIFGNESSGTRGEAGARSNRVNRNPTAGRSVALNGPNRTWNNNAYSVASNASTASSLDELFGL